MITRMLFVVAAFTVLGTRAHAESPSATKTRSPDAEADDNWTFRIVDNRLYGNQKLIDAPLCAAPVETKQVEPGQFQPHVVDDKATLAKLTKRGYTWNLFARSGFAVFVTRRAGNEPCNIAVLRAFAEHRNPDENEYLSSVSVMTPPGMRLTDHQDSTAGRPASVNLTNGYGTDTRGRPLDYLGPLSAPKKPDYPVGGLGLVPTGPTDKGAGEATIKPGDLGTIVNPAPVPKKAKSK